MLQLRPKTSSGRFYAPERDIIHCLPKIILQALNNVETKHPEWGPDLCNYTEAILAFIKEGQVKQEETFADIVLNKAKTLTHYENQEAYERLSCEIVLGILNYYRAAKREIPDNTVGESDVDEAVLLAFNEYVTIVMNWPWWRRTLFRLSNYIRRLLAKAPAIIKSPIITPH